MGSIAEKNIWCPVRMAFKMEYEDEEFLRFCQMQKAFSRKSSEGPKPVVVFAWKLLDVTEIWSHKQPHFLENIQGPVDRFHKNLSERKKRVSDFVYEDEPLTQYENTGDDSDFLKAFFRE